MTEFWSSRLHTGRSQLKNFVRFPFFIPLPSPLFSLAGKSVAFRNKTRATSQFFWAGLVVWETNIWVVRLARHCRRMFEFDPPPPSFLFLCWNIKNVSPPVNSTHRTVLSYEVEQSNSWWNRILKTTSRCPRKVFSISKDDLSAIWSQRTMQVSWNNCWQTVCLFIVPGPRWVG